MIGQTISHYLVLEQIGSGGMGVVYRARDERLERDVALKVLSPDLLHEAGFLSRFRREARLLSKLNHPNIATVHDFDVVDGTSFLVMELVQGETLDQKLAAGPLGESEILRLVIQLLQGLRAAHEEGVIHRDLKPNNLKETPDGRLKILDFGLARIVQTDIEATQSTTATAGIVGTLPYMSPEQLQGDQVDVRTDIYSTGVVLYELATGQRPFNESHAPRLIDCILHRTATLPRELNPQVSAGLEAVISRAMEKEPERRYNTAREMCRELERLAGGSASVQEEAPAPENSQAPPMEIAHVLFTDIVGYSKLPMDEQQKLLRRLQNAVRGTPEFVRARSQDQLISLPTGDGMALVFFGEPESAAKCALEISQRLREQPEIKLRMGINSGPVYRVADINANRNVAGGGINIAQRVMDCGDAGHILVSKAVADVLGELSSWQGRLHDLGEVEVKHGVRVHIFNLLTEESGNAALPEKILSTRTAAAKKSKLRWQPYAIGVAAILLMGIVVSVVIHRHGQKPQKNETSLFRKPRVSVAVMGFKNLGKPEVGWLSGALTEMLSTEMGSSEAIRTISPEDVSATKVDLALVIAPSFKSETLTKIRHILHSEYVISGSYVAMGNQPSDTIRVDVHLQDAESGDTVSSFAESGTIATLCEVLSRVGAKLRDHLGVQESSSAKQAKGKSALPSDPEALRLYTEGLGKLRTFDALGAKDLLERSIAIEPNLALPYNALARSWEILGYDQKARENAAKAVEFSADLAPQEQRSIEARAHELNAEWEKAVSLYKSLATVYPDEPNYYLDLANAQISDGKANEALETLKTLGSQPQMKDDPRVDLAVGMAAKSLSDIHKQRDASSASAEKAKSQGSRLLAAHAYWQLCSAYFALGEFKEGEAACDESGKSAPFDDEIKARSESVWASILEAQGKNLEALEMRRRALETARRIGSQKDIVGALQNLANLVDQEGNSEEARAYYEQAVNISHFIDDKSGLLGAQNSLAGHLYQEGDFDGAESLYRKSLELARSVGDQEAIAMGLEDLAAIQLLRGKLADAQNGLEQAGALQQQAGLEIDRPNTLNLLGDVLFANGNLTAARNSYELSFKLSSDQQAPSGIAASQAGLANINLYDGKQAEAEKLARTATNTFADQKIVDSEASTRNILALVLLKEGRVPEARAELDRSIRLSPRDRPTQLSLKITDALLKAREGKSSEALSDLKATLRESDKLKLAGLSLETKLAQAEIESVANPQLAEQHFHFIEIEAREKGFLQLSSIAHAKFTGIGR
jgi:serine/threonine protein kinase/tetratricopeptide (TPR) repeat protein